MSSMAIKSLIGSAVIALGLGFGASKAAADSFHVGISTPGASVGYGYSHGYGHSGFVGVYAPGPVYYPAPVVACPPVPVYVPAPVVVAQAPVYYYETRPVSRFYVNDYGRRVYYTDYVRVRVEGHRHSDDRGRGHDGHHGDDHHGHRR